MRVQGVGRDVLPFTGHFTQIRAQITLFFTLLIILTSGESSGAPRIYD
jgi:amino acid transporter